MGHCIFKAKHVACKITATCFRCFFNLKQYTIFFPLPCHCCEGCYQCSNVYQSIMQTLLLKILPCHIRVFLVKIFFQLWVNFPGLQASCKEPVRHPIFLRCQGQCCTIYFFCTYPCL